MAARDHGPAAARSSFFHWLVHLLSTTRVSRLSRIIALLFLILFLLSIAAHHYLSTFGAVVADGNGPGGAASGQPNRFIGGEHGSDAKISSDLRFQIDELNRIKVSVSNELRDLEKRRQQLHLEVSGYNSRIEREKVEYEASALELNQLRISIKNMNLEREEAAKARVPNLQAPRRVLPSIDDAVDIPPPGSSLHCRMHSCFDYSRCSLTSKFPVYFYSPDEYALTDAKLEPFVKLSVVHALNSSPYVTFDAHTACLFVVVVGDTVGVPHNRTTFEQRLRRLQYWNGDGRNHVLLNLARYHGNQDMFDGVDTGRAIVAQSAFTERTHRGGYNVIIPPSLGVSHGSVWQQLMPLVPARRQHLVSFEGQFQYAEMSVTAPLQRSIKNKINSYAGFNLNNSNDDEGEDDLDDVADNGFEVHPGKRKLSAIARRRTKRSGDELVAFENTIVQTLKLIQTTFPPGRNGLDGFHFEFSCSKELVAGVNADWSLCGPDTERHKTLKNSVFALIIAPCNQSVISTVHMQTRLYEAMKFGAIPVILGEHARLPFAELIDWSRAVVTLPKPRVTELHFFLQSYPDARILEMRQQGRLIWETYFGSTKSVIDTLLATLRTRLSIPAFPAREAPSRSVFNSSFVPLVDKTVIQPESEDILGPLEEPFPSLRYQRNFTHDKGVFNRPGNPFTLYPFTPFDPVMPGGAKFVGSTIGFRPIGKGEGGAGKEFNEALGGNVPREQFTVVMLTYEREMVLLNAVSRLKGLPHLHSVVIVWNNPRLPADDLRWPDIGVKVHVVRTLKNSLNNRFLPYDVIETEAVLSIDDDAHLRHDEIMFGFSFPGVYAINEIVVTDKNRVWREARDRIVGFPGRFHAWDLKHDTWMYNSNYSCELSMVLTGAAFFHKYYMYLYSQVMPEEIRDKVDEFLNCEDLAMNFLVAHVTRKPPIKVTSRWTFRCPGCPQALSVEEGHFNERHKCINFFVRVYGYMPLINTQFRADSVLFKTRIPHDKQKCFKFI